MSETSRSTGLVVIGGGPGGYAAAFLAADLGMEVTLVDLDVNPGGVCLYRGCIPSKALLHAAKVIRESEAAEAWGRGHRCTEFASDADPENEVSRRAHGAVGFEDVGLVRCFRKDL